MTQNTTSPDHHFTVWYEGDNDREDKVFTSFAAAKRFASRIGSRDPIIDDIKFGQLVGSFSFPF
jgi:hypothetical protein